MGSILTKMKIIVSKILIQMPIEMLIPKDYL